MFVWKVRDEEWVATAPDGIPEHYDHWVVGDVLQFGQGADEVRRVCGANDGDLRRRTSGETS